MKFYFATLFDINYASRGLALLSSMRQHIPEFHLFILCLDDSTYKVFSALNTTEITLIGLNSLEEKDPELLVAKKNRNKIEYIFTLSPALPLYILSNYPRVDLITTLDADIYFFDNPGPMFKELEGNSIMITPHRFSEKLKERERYGKFNVSFQSFRRDENGMACLTWWREKCMEWCYTKRDKGRFADQKYLDEFETRFKGVVSMKHLGAGLAPWNIGNYGIIQKKNNVFIENYPLVFYHFHHLRFIRKRLLLHSLDDYGFYSNRIIKNKIYEPYIERLIVLNKKYAINDNEVSWYRENYSDPQTFRDLLIFGNTYFYQWPIGLIEIHLENIYKRYKYFKNIYIRN